MGKKRTEPKDAEKEQCDEPKDAENEQYDEHLQNAKFYQRRHIAKSNQKQMRRWMKRERKQRHQEKHLNFKIGQTMEVLYAKRDDLHLRNMDVLPLKYQYAVEKKKIPIL